MLMHHSTPAKIDPKLKLLQFTVLRGEMKADEKSLLCTITE
jgi:hypothetical protein